MYGFVVINQKNSLNLIMIVLKFAKLTEKAFVPTKGSKYAAGYDLRRYVFEIFRLDKIAVSDICIIFFF